MIEFYLKILSGNHQGAEIPLEPGSHTLGKGDQCDLVLTDDSLSDLELTINISPEGQLSIVCHSEEGLLYSNGTPQGSETHTQPFDIITSSQLFFSLGPVDADWPDQPLPELQRPEPEPEEPEPEEDPDLEIDDDDEFPDAPDGLFDDEDNEVDRDNLNSLDEDLAGLDIPDSNDNEGDEESDEEDDEEAFENPLKNIDRKWLIGVPAGIFTFFLLLILFLSGGSDDELPELSHLDQAKQIRNQLNQKNVKLKELPDQSILISGYTLTMNDKQTIQRELREKGIPFSSQLVVMSELRANADALLKNQGHKSLSLELDNSPGSLVMTGYVPSSEELQKIIAALKQEVHGLVSIVDQVENQAGRLNTLKSMLREKGLSPRIHLIQKPNQITLEGHLLDDEQVYNLNDVVTRFRKRYGNQPQLRLATKSAGAPAKVINTPLAPSLKIRAVSMGRVPFVTMQDGAKYLIGAKLANGYIIEDINLEYLLLSKGTDRIKYRLGGKSEGSTNRQ
ncbi:type III secretion system inner membrane ring subunit SctD [Endozoicomonas arenosclerae]|uniref:type III secretion system inner membrane ring subunit SctD n=1 Tax=Endozoicomonas arenosclerae TaxID=1633495 RepID=UPI00078451D2|nr:type III secretion system inner membrane ring subunit SctD [Endozoicomonas arenosclerae]